MIGDVIDHYRVLQLIGRGAMGVVYKALDVNLDRTVAVKVMSAEARNDPDFVERFRQEARLQGALNHPNVALLFDYFIHDGAPVAVMEFIDGESLEQWIRRRGPVPAHECVPVFKQALRGVAAAHRAGIIHRDLKPGNLMVTRDGTVKVMDFGIAKRQGAAGATHVSTSIGTTLYMAPEQILGRAIDCRTDVYALGITLYELLSGRPPFDPRGKAQYMILNAHVNDLPEPPTVHCREIPQPLVDAVMRALAKDPAARFQSADDFMHALPDVPVPAPRAVAPGLGPTGTVALEPLPATSAEPGVEPSRTMVFEYAPTAQRDRRDSTAVEYSAATLARESDPRRAESANSSPPAAGKLPGGPAVAAKATSLSSTPTRATRERGAPGGSPWLVRAARLVIAAVLAATLVLGTLMILRGSSLGPSSPRVTQVQASTPLPPPTPAEPSPSPPVVPSAGAEQTTASSPELTGETAPPAATTLATTTPPVQPDLSGTWSGEYVDGSGRQLLRVVNLSIRRVHDDGGIDGTLQYEAASGIGWCKLYPRHSTYSAGARRLQLSPEGCSPHYPKELGVPLDFDGVSPRATTLKDGRIEAPTGEVISVKLNRVSGI